MTLEDEVIVSIDVALGAHEAFRVFTEEVDAWWGRGPKFRNFADPSSLRFEPGVGGRFIETGAERELAIGEISVWEPGSRLVMSWHPGNFAPGEALEVEVRFAPTGAEGTRVTVIHRGWSGLDPDHPARHGLEGRALWRMRGGWLSELLGFLKRHAEGVA